MQIQRAQGIFMGFMMRVELLLTDDECRQHNPNSEPLENIGVTLVARRLAGTVLHVNEPQWTCTQMP